jgi:4-hydroxy-tetrahydrodipicolinate synthase
VAESERLAPLWSLFAEFGGSLRVVAAIAEHLDLAPHQSLPLPIQGLTEAQRARVAEVVDELLLDR